MSIPQCYPLTITDLQPETDAAVCITFEVPDELKPTFQFKQGQYLTLEAEIDGHKVRRSYSICSGVNDDNLTVAVKRVKGGLFSNFANDELKKGDRILVMPPQGKFYSEVSADNKKNYMCLAVGSGITPMLSIMKTVLETEPDSEVTLIYGNRSTSTTLFRETLSFLKNRYMRRFKWINIMSREDQGSDVLSGHIDNHKGYELQKRNLIDIKRTDEAFICGPESMMSEVSRGFRIEGLDNSQIHYELFASSAEDSEERMQKARQRIHEYGENKTSLVTVKADGRALQFDLAATGENILDAGIEHGMALPYSCKAGVCSTCKAKLIKGQVDMDISHGLEPDEIEQGYILTCQAHPISDEVDVDFDQR